ncbi:MAG: hypothetical protein Q4P34_01380 [Tissierellia bacterium]|nr:hypothetical protein [Tissierellia bacterium]
MSFSNNIKKYFLLLPMVGISVSIFAIVLFMFTKTPSSTESIAYALIPTLVNSFISFISIIFYSRKDNFDLKNELKDIKWTTGAMFFSLLVFIIIYSKFF